jgi:hypothetical protein
MSFFELSQTSVSSVSSVVKISLVVNVFCNVDQARVVNDRFFEIAMTERDLFNE